MYLIFSKLDGRTLRRHLKVSFLVNKKPFNSCNMLSPSMDSFFRVLGLRWQGDIVNTIFIRFTPSSTQVCESCEVKPEVYCIYLILNIEKNKNFIDSTLRRICVMPMSVIF